MAFSSDDFPHPEGPEILAISPLSNCRLKPEKKSIVAVGDTGIFYLQHGVPLIFCIAKIVQKNICAIFDALINSGKKDYDTE
mgnify:CR=1 FL=1